MKKYLTHVQQMLVKWHFTFTKSIPLGEEEVSKIGQFNIVQPVLSQICDNR